MKYCIKCVLPETFPGIKFNDEGICNYCLSFKGEEKLKEDKVIYLNKFKELIKQLKGKSDYDCTLSFSGGKDSTYTLYVIKEIFKLKVLVLTFDNGFVSKQAFENIRNVTEKLKVDSLVFKPNFDILKKIFSYAKDNEMYSPKTVERASTICTSCIGLVKFVFLKIALEKNIPMMVWGWSPGQAPVRSSIMKMNPVLFKTTQELLKEPMKKIVGNEINTYFLNDSYFKNSDIFPYNISPLAFMDYNENKIIEKIKEFGWISPEDVDTNSTNCLLNSFANQIHQEQYGFHPYAFEIAEMVRSGVMCREEGLKKISDVGNQNTIGFAKKKLEID